MDVGVKFSQEDRQRLQELGVSDHQIFRLQQALPFVRVFANKNSYAPNAEIAEILLDIQKHANGLSKRLTALITRPSAAHGAAHGLIEERYWVGERWEDEGPTSSHHLLPRLKALEGAAEAASASLPPGRPSRRKTADPRPIRHIDEALRQGWLRDQGSRVRSSRGDESLVEMLEDARATIPLPPYPKTFCPSTATSRAFREIVGICYQSVGGTADPRAAIENYLKAEREIRKEARAALEEGIKSASE